MNHGKEPTMANQQGKRQDERESTTMEKSGDGGERGLATRQYQDPLSMLDSLFERMQRDFFGTTLFNAMLPAGAAEGDRGVVRVPRMQMRDSGDAIELTAELPGIEPDQVKVELEDDMLTISGEAEAKEEREDERIERSVSFYRQIPLPDSVDADQAQASYNNGVLTIRFPKRAERSHAKQIPVTTGQSAQQGGQQTGQQAKDKAA
jgi:HSP20 family protein